jgi:hypothetical protein
MPEDSRQDDGFHAPGSDDPSWTETCWFAFHVPERRLSGTLYPLFRPNLGVCASAVHIWDDTAHEPWDALYSRNLWHVGFPDGDLTRLSLPGGLRYECLEPATRFALGYEHGDEIALDLTFEGLLPPHYLGTSHLDQPGRVHGTVRLHGEEIAVDCLSIRDRTWSPRSDLSDTIMGTALSGGYSHATASATEGFQVLSAALDTAPGAPARVLAGYLVRDGEIADVTGGRREVVARRDGRPTVVSMEIEDALGRRLVLEGRHRNAFAWQFTPSMFSWICLTHWTWDGGEAWGEDHDNWSNVGWRAFRRGAR